MNALLPLVVITPLSGAALALAMRGSAAATRAIAVVTLVVQLGIEVGMLASIDSGGPMVVHLGGHRAPIGITLVADRLASVLQLISTVVTLAVLIYAIAQQRRGARPDGSSAAFYPAMLVMSAGVSDAFVAGDLFNLFVSFEILLTASYVLLTLGGTAERIRAGTPYVVVSLLSSVLFLAGIALIYAATGTVNLADLSEKIGDLPPGLAGLLQALLLVAFGIKAAVWPMSAWLPESYPSAPAPVTAVFAGLLTKVGIYAIVRVQTLLSGGHERFTVVLMAAALATMLVGILGAIAEGDIKRMLSFTLVSHIGYMLFGLALGSQVALAATAYYIVHHILVQTALFLAAGLIEYLRGTTKLVQLGGLARAAPLLAVLFFVPAMNLAGVPPLSGFLGKVGLFEAGLAAGGVWPVMLVVGGAATSLLTLYAIVRVWGRAFWRPTPLTGAAVVAAQPSEDESAMSPIQAERVVVLDAVDHVLPGAPTVELPSRIRAHVLPAKLPRGMLAATVGIVLAGLMLTVAGGPIYGFLDRAASDIADPHAYVSAVLDQP
jgi:multicomponent Na+:H+ antiporter subunit D